MKVPKCKECELKHEYKYPSGLTYRSCWHKGIALRMIGGNEARTSPKWCPKRGGKEDA